ncbi:MAG: sigma factor-like helix-turn-helix DNA-binding protein, partial [Gemmatimonadota bacterium]
LVQDAFARWHESAPPDVDEPEAWLVAVTTRLAIDRLRRRAAERKEYPGPWLPQPVSSERFSRPPDRDVELTSDLSMAFLVMLERLAPEERAAFLLREVFDHSYAEIASILEKKEPAARQMVHRARDRVRTPKARFAVSPAVVDGLFDQLESALRQDDEEALLALFAPDATFTSDGGGKVNAARRVIRGAHRVVRLLTGLKAKYPQAHVYTRTVLNGEPALVQHVADRVFSVSFMATDGARITAMYRVLNPDKLADVRR